MTTPTDTKPKQFFPTFVDGELSTVSASQIKTFQLCQLKWVLGKKLKLPQKPQSKGAQTGDEAHQRMEHWLLTGEDVRSSLERNGHSMIEPFLWAAPFNGGRGIVEGKTKVSDPKKPIELFTAGKVRISGYVDFYIPGGWHRSRAPDMPPFSASLVDPVIIDHKFRSNIAHPPEGYAETEEDLKTDEQALIYGAHALLEAPEAHGVVFRHHNHQTRGTGSIKPVQVRFTREDLFTRFAELGRLIDGPMAELARTEFETVPDAAARVPVPEDRHEKLGACNAFAGCDFRNVCPKAPQASWLAGVRATLTKPAAPIIDQSEPAAPQPLPKEQQMGLLPADQKPAIVGETAAPGLTDVVEVRDCKQGTDYITPNGAVGKFYGLVGTRHIFRMGDKSLLELKPDELVSLAQAAPAAAQPVTTQTAPAVVTAAPEKERKLLVKVATPPPENIAPPDMPKEEAVPQIKVEAKEVAPVKVEAQPVAVVEVKTETALAEAPKEEKPKAAKAKKAAAAPAEAQAIMAKPTEDQLFLLINCTCSQAIDLSAYVENICSKVAADHGAPDVRLGHSKSDLAFGGWKGLVALRALQDLPKGICAIYTSEKADPIIEALIPKAALVVRGGGR